MGKVAGVFGIIFGMIILLIGFGIVWGVLANNMLIIFAGQYLILAVLVMAIGGFIIYKGKCSIDRAVL
jgi:hypothetical protein